MRQRFEFILDYLAIRPIHESTKLTGRLQEARSQKQECAAFNPELFNT